MSQSFHPSEQSSLSELGSTAHGSSGSIESVSTDAISQRLLERIFGSATDESLPAASSRGRTEARQHATHPLSQGTGGLHSNLANTPAYTGARPSANPYQAEPYYASPHHADPYYASLGQTSSANGDPHASTRNEANRYNANSVLPISVLRALERKDAKTYPQEVSNDDVRNAVSSLQNQSLEALNSKISEDSKLRTTDPAGKHAASRTSGLNTSKSTSGKWDQNPTSTRGLDVRSVRADFPALHQDINGHQLVWFDNGATTHKPISVIEAMTQFYACDYSNIHRAAHTLAARATDHYEAAREAVRDFINAESTNDIVFVRGTTEGINFIAHTFKSLLREGDEILLTEMEHHANIVPWQLMAEEKRVRIRVIPFDDQGEIMLDEYRRLLSPRTKLVSVTHASNTLGTILPVEEMAAMAHRKGAKFVVDGAQSIAHLPVDVQSIGCDFFVFSGHKVFAPTGIGAVYVHPDMQELLPPWQGGGNMIHRVSFDGTTFSDPPAKFEAGTPSIGDAVGLGAALRYVQQFDPVALLQHEHALLEHATQRLEAIRGVRTIGHAPHKVGVISFVLQGYTTEQVGKELDRFGIAVRTGHHCAQPSLRHFGLESTVRPSFALYNTHEEVDRLADVIQKMARRS